MKVGRAPICVLVGVLNNPLAVGRYVVLAVAVSQLAKGCPLFVILPRKRHTSLTRIASCLCFYARGCFAARGGGGEWELDEQGGNLLVEC
jgi:hypothetical protein